MQSIADSGALMNPYESRPREEFVWFVCCSAVLLMPVSLTACSSSVSGDVSGEFAQALESKSPEAQIGSNSIGQVRKPRRGAKRIRLHPSQMALPAKRWPYCPLKVAPRRPGIRASSAVQIDHVIAHRPMHGKKARSSSARMCARRLPTILTICLPSVVPQTIPKMTA